MLNILPVEGEYYTRGDRALFQLSLIETGMRINPKIP